MEADVFLHKYPELTKVFQEKNIKLRVYSAIFTVIYEAFLKHKTPKKAVAISGVGFSDDENETPIQEVKSKLDFTGEMDSNLGDERIIDLHRKRSQVLAETQENKNLISDNALKHMEVEYQQGNINFNGPVEYPKVVEK